MYLAFNNRAFCGFLTVHRFPLMLTALNCPDLRPNTSWAAGGEFPMCVCGARVPPKERIFYKSQASPIGYGLSCSGERQLPGNSTVSVEVIPRWVIWSYAARNKGREEKRRKKNLIAPAIKRSNLQQGQTHHPSHWTVMYYSLTARWCDTWWASHFLVVQELIFFLFKHFLIFIDVAGICGRWTGKQRPLLVPRKMKTFPLFGNTDNLTM